jgi:hypothetical protein
VTTEHEREQEERRQYLANEKLLREKAAEDRRASTYLAMALADSELPGRFGKVTQKHIVGASPGPIYPAQPESSPFHHDPTGNLPDPLGYAIDDQPPVGEPFEIEAAQRILDERSSVPPDDGSSAAVPAVPLAAVERAELPTTSPSVSISAMATGGAVTVLPPVAAPPTLRRRL